MNADNTISEVKVGMLVSYDWKLLARSIPCIYAEADKIVLAIDKDRLTWAGNKFELTNEFYRLIEQLDVDGKVELYEDNFYNPSYTVMQNDTRERNLLADYMGKGGWHIQIDADEYFLDFGKFVTKLRQVNAREPITIYCKWVPLIKKLKDGYLAVNFDELQSETFPVATTYPQYKAARQDENPIIIFDDLALHETWARNDSELITKLGNWSHSGDFSVDSYYKLWLALDENNFKYIKNFHPIDAQVWPSLKYIVANDIQGCIDSITKDVSEKNHIKQVNNKRNNETVQRIKCFLKGICYNTKTKNKTKSIENIVNDSF